MTVALSGAVSPAADDKRRGSREKLYPVQVLRAIAACLVVVAHGVREAMLANQVVAPEVWQSINGKCNFGVDLFFIISGFIMIYVTVDLPPGRGASLEFLAKRGIRVIPLYWATTMLFVLLSVLLPSLKHSNDHSFGHIVASLSFIPVVSPVYGLGWTLNFEMFFYVTLSLLLVFNVRWIFPAVSLVFLTLIVAGIWFAPKQLILQTWTDPLLLEFLFGATLATLRVRGVRIGVWAQIALLIVGVLLWLLLPTPPDGASRLRGFVWGPPAALISAGLVMGRAELTFPKFLLLIGDASYSLYLTHFFVLRLCALVVFHLPVSPTLQLIVFLIVFSPAAILGAIVSYRWFERPTMRLGTSLIARMGSGAVKIRSPAPIPGH